MNEVAVVMGSQSDWETMSCACEMLNQFGIPHLVEIISAHRTPDKLQDFANSELEAQRKKHTDFNQAQAEIVSKNIIQKITNHFAHHLKDDDVPTDESLELIKKVFQLETSKHV